MIPSTSHRVTINTADSVNAQIRQCTRARVQHIASQGPSAIRRRLLELDDEWDIERYLETMAPTFTLLGLTLGITRHRSWLLLPFVVQTFFLQHALQGWCPPIPVLRRMGIRTCQEIEQERHALKALRGDFDNVSSSHDEATAATRAIAATES